MYFSDEVCELGRSCNTGLTSRGTRQAGWRAVQVIYASASTTSILCQGIYNSDRGFDIYVFDALNCEFVCILMYITIKGEFPSDQNISWDVLFYPYSTVCMLHEIFAHHSFFFQLEAYVYVCLHCRCSWVAPVVSVMDPIVHVCTRRSTHTPLYSCAIVMWFCFVCVMICIQ